MHEAKPPLESIDVLLEHLWDGGAEDYLAWMPDLFVGAASPTDEERVFRALQELHSWRAALEASGTDERDSSAAPEGAPNRPSRTLEF